MGPAAGPSVSGSEVSAPISEGFIADFYCHDEKLIVEVDGAVHSEPEQRKHDENRDIVLRKLGIKLLRVSNDEVFEDLEAVLRKIAHFTKVPYRLGQ